MGWTRAALTFYAGAVVPLALPGVYVPVDPKVRFSLPLLHAAWID